MVCFVYGLVYNFERKKKVNNREKKIWVFFSQIPFSRRNRMKPINKIINIYGTWRV